MKFAKMHGLGNDFIVVNGFEEHLDESILAKLSKWINNRNFGVGGDGLLLVLPSETADFCMRMMNPDGSEAEMCGNGIRCAAKFAYEHGVTTVNPVRVETLGGIKVIDLTIEDGEVTAARVDMGKPRLERNEIPMTGEGAGPVVNEPLAISDGSINVTCVNMGNPHCITFVDDAENYPVGIVGPQVERHKVFPARTNAEFIEVINRKEIRMRVWERGAAVTLACGTGACAATVASILNGKTERAIIVHLDGGDLEIEWIDGGSVMMTGPAVEVFNGEIPQKTIDIWVK